MAERVLPPEFSEMLREAVGNDLAGKITEAILNTPPVTSVRKNPAKWPRLAAAGHSLAAGRTADNGGPAQIPWCPDGLYLAERPNFTMDPAFHAGAYYVQEPSSMIIEVLRPLAAGAARLLDLCAAPGGKTTHLASMMGGAAGSPAEGPAAARAGGLTANEIIRSRAATLRDNITKWGDPRITVTSLDPSAFAKFGHRFDFILVDAPCSGEGMFRKDPDSITEWSVRAVNECVVRQRKIVKDIWETLEPGGHLAYSTCTMNRHENEENISWFAQTLGAQIVPLGPYLQATLHHTATPDNNNLGIILTPEGSLRLHPGLVKGEGIFLALLRKPDDDSSSNSNSSLKTESGSNLNSNSSRSSAPKPNAYGNSKANGNGKQMVTPPEHADAYAVNYFGPCPSVELTKEQAISYLCRDSLSLPESPAGYLRVTYCGLGLGFVKNIGSRANNLLPKSLRILNRKMG